MCLGTSTPTVSPCWKLKIIWSPTSETSTGVIYSLYFILYFIQLIIYLCLAHGAGIYSLYSVFQITTRFSSLSAAHHSAEALRGTCGTWHRCRWSWDVAGGLIPALWEMRFFFSPSCSYNFDQVLMWLDSDPDMTGPGTCIRREWRWGWRGGRVSDLTRNPGEERNYSEGVFPMLLFCLVGNKGFMYSFYPGKNCNL